MESEFEPAVSIQETHEAFIVEINVPGFRREDLKVRANNRGSLVISGERGAKEMDCGGRSPDKMQKAGCSFREVIRIPENLNFDGITAKFRDETLRVSLPLLHVSDQQNQDTLPGSEKPDQSLKSRVERSSPAGQQDSMKEQPAPAPAPVQDDQSARHPEAIRQNDDKEKSPVAAKDSNELVEKKSVEAPKQAEKLVGEPLISRSAQAVSDEMGSAHRSEEDGGKKSVKPPEFKDPPEEKKKLDCADHGKPVDKSQPPECKHPLEEKKKEACGDDGKPSEKSHQGNGDGVSGIVERYFPHQQAGKKDDQSCCSTRRINTFPDLKRIQFPASSSSTVSKRGVLIASSVLVLSVGLYITIKSRRRHHI